MNQFDTDTGTISERENQTQVNAIDAQKFVLRACEKGVAEIEAARAALEKAELTQVKEFAERMIRDHGEANQTLKAIALQQGLEVEDDATLVDKAKQFMMKMRSGESFDHAYLHNQIDEHEKAIELYEKAGQSTDTQISEFARDTLPKLRDHLHQAKQIYAAVA